MGKYRSAVLVVLCAAVLAAGVGPAWAHGGMTQLVPTDDYILGRILAGEDSAGQEDQTQALRCGQA